MEKLVIEENELEIEKDMSPSKYKVRRLKNGTIRLSKDGQLVGDMDLWIWERYYKPKLVGLEVEYLGF